MLAAGAAAVGVRGVGNWLAARGFGWVTRTRITVATVLFVTVAIVAVVLGTADRVVY